MDFSESKKTPALICLVLAAVTLGVYWRVVGFDFINYDDPDYVTENSVVKNGLTLGGVGWAFTHFYASNWHPLTWISHMLDWQMFGPHAGGHHLVNVFLHAANAVLLFLLLRRLTGAQWRSAMVAALFALHPLRVESVAWVAERKDVLSTFFGLLALLAYVRYAEEFKVQSSKSKIWYAGALVGFVFSLMAKPMLVTLPFVMLLLDFWPLQRVENSGWRTFFTPQFRKLVLGKWPWFALALVSSVVTFIAQKRGGAVSSVEYFPLGWRVANASEAYFNYILKAGWPAHLAVFYPIPHGLRAGPWFASSCFLIAASVAAVVTIKRRPFFLMGWLWFLGTLIPVIGLVQVGSQAMADRYTYVPLIGIFIIVVWGVSELLARSRAGKIACAMIAVGVLGLFTVTTFSQLQYWQNSLALFNHALAVTRDNAPANNNLGTALVALGRRDEALPHYGEAVRIDPDNAHYQNNFATALERAGQPDAAVDHYLAAIRVEPRFAKAYSNLGSLYLDQHRLDDALIYLNQAVQIEPGNDRARSNLGNALAAAGKLEDALTQYSEAVRLNPTNAAFHLNAGLTLVKAGRANDAMAQFADAVRLNPASAEARYELGRQLFLQGQFQSAIEQLGEASKLRPDYAVAEFYQAAALGETGRFDEALAMANLALEGARKLNQTNLMARIEEAREFYKSGHPYRPKAPKSD